MQEEVNTWELHLVLTFKSEKRMSSSSFRCASSWSACRSTSSLTCSTRSKSTTTCWYPAATSSACPTISSSCSARRGSSTRPFSPTSRTSASGVAWTRETSCSMAVTWTTTKCSSTARWSRLRVRLDAHSAAQKGPGVSPPNFFWWRLVHTLSLRYYEKQSLHRVALEDQIQQVAAREEEEDDHNKLNRAQQQLSEVVVSESQLTNRNCSSRFPLPSTPYCWLAKCLLLTHRKEKKRASAFQGRNCLWAAYTRTTWTTGATVSVAKAASCRPSPGSCSSCKWAQTRVSRTLEPAALVFGEDYSAPQVLKSVSGRKLPWRFLHEADVEREVLARKEDNEASHTHAPQD